MSLKNICFITDGYPHELRIVNAFVETLVNQITDTGINCIVIAPQSLTNIVIHKRKMVPSAYSRYTSKGNEVKVFSPKYMSFSNKKILFFNSNKLNLLSFKKCVMQKFDELNKIYRFDAVYGHFIFPAGIVSNYIGKKYGIPSFFAYGENTTYSIEYLGKEKTKELLREIDGVIAVSSENKRILIDNNIVSEEKIGVFPNSINSSIFYPRDKMLMRKKLGFPENAFVVAFVGRFLNVKGPDRLSAAINELNNKDIYSIFIGDGPLKPDCNNILFCGPLEHSEIPDYLSASDVFVLPTLAEGCCNAIIEAMACGLPIVSSDKEFNNDILNKSCSIRIDSNNKLQISEAIDLLYKNSDIREKMRDEAVKMASSLDINERAKNIINFINMRAGR